MSTKNLLTSLDFNKNNLSSHDLQAAILNNDYSKHPSSNKIKTSTLRSLSSERSANRTTSYQPYKLFPSSRPQKTKQQFKSKQSSTGLRFDDYTLRNSIEFDNIKDHKALELLDKIMTDQSNFIYESDEVVSVGTHRSRNHKSSLDISPIRKSQRTPTDIASPKLRILTDILKGSPDRQYNIGFESERREETIDSRKSGDLKNYEPHKFTPRDSKFAELVNLKRQNTQLSLVNSKLQQEVEGIDEFERILNKKAKMENFNEKRCDLLKASLKKQKRYITHITSSLKLAKKFYKDLNKVLNFFMEVEEKYKKHEKDFNQIPSQQQNEFDLKTNLMNRALYRLQNEHGNTKLFKDFMSNFNEAYDLIKGYHEGTEELKQLFNLPPSNGNHLNNNNPSVECLDQEFRNKVKYKYVLSQFVEKYQTAFPLQTAFNGFTSEEKIAFSDLIHQLKGMTQKVNEVFTTLKGFDILPHSQYMSNIDVPKLYEQNADNFGYYFHTFNHAKRMILNGDQLLDLEKSLAGLLGQLIKFHNELTLKGREVSVDEILKIQQNLRTNIESLLALGITINCNISYKDQVIVVTKQSSFEEEVEPLRATSIPKKGALFEIYKEEHENVRKYQGLMDNMKMLLEQSIEESEKISSKSLNKKLRTLNEYMEYLQINYQDMGLVSRLKDIEMNFTREYSKILDSSMTKVRSFVEEESKLVEDFLEKITARTMEIRKGCESAILVENNDPKLQKILSVSFERIIKDIKQTASKLLGKKNEIDYGNVRTIGDIFLKNLEKIKEEYQQIQLKMKGIGFKIQKGREQKSLSDH